MPSDPEKAINQLKEELEKAKSLRYRAEARLEQLEQQQADLLKEIRALGVEPEKLDQEIAALKTEIDRLLAEASQLLPHDLLK